MGANLLNQQLAICRRYGAEYCPSPPHVRVGIAENIKSGLMPLNGLRHPEEGDTTGWYIWAGIVDVLALTYHHQRSWEYPRQRTRRSRASTRSSPGSLR